MKRRKYYRKCGICGEIHEQLGMIRTYESPTGWICLECLDTNHPEYSIEEW